MENNQVKNGQAGNMNVEIHSDSKAASIAAARDAGDVLRKLAETRVSFGAIFATGVSQMQTLGALRRIEGLLWDKVRGFQMDEYVRISADHPASFRGYLCERLTQKVSMKEFREIDGNTSDPEKAADDYSALLRAADLQLCLLGIGENGHLAFDDPSLADFSDPRDAKVVNLDASRRRQAAEGWFTSVDEVADAAITLTFPASEYSS